MLQAGQSATGSIDVAEDYVRLEVLLPWLLARLVGTIQPLIRKEGTLLIEKKSTEGYSGTLKRFLIKKCAANV